MEEYIESRYANFKETDNYSCSQKYKGVVPLHSANWGAQIYTNNQRIWLGTFKSEIDAATAYDRASMKLRTADFPRNFPFTKSTLQEVNFQSQHTVETILAMIKDGSYEAKFEGYQRQKEGNGLCVEKGNFGFSCRVLFEKELTPSDVGRLNRLVIPKRYAVKYFPRVPDDVAHGFGNDEVTLSFYDTANRLWTFRYCYWKSSQSFVFTRGWSQFVKDKKLRTKDKLIFYYQENLEVPNMGFWMIDTCQSTSNSGESLKLGVEGEDGFKGDSKMDDEIMQTSSVKTHGLKLFGVHIIQ